MGCKHGRINCKVKEELKKEVAKKEKEGTISRSRF
jgi:hypothetical protein